MPRFKKLNPFAIWVIALAFVLMPFVGFLNAAPVAAQETSTPTDGNGTCEAAKPQQSFFVYNTDEDEVGYDTSLPKHDPWQMTVGLDVLQHTEVYMGPGLPTVSVVTDPLKDGESPRTVYAYGSQFFWEKIDCKHYDGVSDARNYAKIRATRGHSGIVVDMTTGKVYMELNNPDTRVYKVSKDDVPALLATFDNAKAGEKNLFDGVKLTWADTGEAISLPDATKTGGTQSSLTDHKIGQAAASKTSDSTSSGDCKVAQPTRVEDAQSVAGSAPTAIGDDNSYRIVSLWSNQWSTNLNAVNDPNVKEADRNGSLLLFLKPNQDISGMLGLNGAVWQWPAECGTQAAADFNSKPASLRVSVSQYLAWVKDMNSWPKGGATAKP